MAPIRILIVLCLCATAAAFTFGCSNEANGGPIGEGGSGGDGGSAGDGGSGGGGGMAGMGGMAGAGGMAGMGGIGGAPGTGGTAGMGGGIGGAPGTGGMAGMGGIGGAPGTGGTAGMAGAGGMGGMPAEVVYEQNFESLDQASLSALGDAGFLVFGNEYQPDGTPIQGYGPFPAPNNPAAAAFSLIAAGEGGATQGVQQLVIISDYNNGGNMTAGNLVEANTFQEPFPQTSPITAADFGTYTFSFDAKLGDLTSPSTALAFIKTLDPGAGFATTNFITEPTTNIAATWARYSITLVVDAALVGQILQFGFSATTTNFVASGVVYDNILFTKSPTP